MKRRRAVSRKIAKRRATAGYRPNVWGQTALYGPNDQAPLYQVLRDVPVMLRHPRVRLSLNYYKSAISSVEHEVEAPSSEIKDFAMDQLERFWSRCLDDVQERSYGFGWMGGEPFYEVKNGLLNFDGLEAFHPWDVRVMTRDHDKALWGIRVRMRSGGYPGSVQGKISLDGPRYSSFDVPEDVPDYPSQAFWHSHNSWQSKFYGETQLYSAWRPWRRLAGLDGAENVIDGGFYRTAYQGPIIYFPPQDEQDPDATDGAEDNADTARQLSEWWKAGCSIAVPNLYDSEGRELWKIIPPDMKGINLGPHLEYVEYLRKEISDGIGVPSELMEASDTGSGYSGRAIPMENFIAQQQKNADLITRSFCYWILEPLVRWNFGHQAWVEVNVAPLLQTKMEQMQPPQPDQGMGMPGMPGMEMPGMGEEEDGQGMETSGMGEEEGEGDGETDDALAALLGA